MSSIRVLIIDDSVIIRRIVAEALSADPAITVVGVAQNGRIGLAKLEQLRPDLVITDVEMPEMNGLETLAEIRKLRPGIPVIMYSSFTDTCADTIVEALALGASDYLAKPTQMDCLLTAVQEIRRDLAPRIKALCNDKCESDSHRVHPPSPSLRRASPPATSRRTNELDPRRVGILAIGSSAGGPNALAEILSALPHDFPAAIVIAQHMPANFTRLLADRLNAKSSIAVSEARRGVLLRPGHAYVAPGNYHMLVLSEGDDCRIELNQDPHENSCRPAVDVLFRSVASAFGPRALGVVLTGMGQDGLRGSEEIRAAGGRVLAQDEATSVVWGMPGFVAKAGLAEEVLPLKAIAKAVAARVIRERVPLTV